jgi:hypothetical protein
MSEPIAHPGCDVWMGFLISMKIYSSKREDRCIHFGGSYEDISVFL